MHRMPIVSPTNKHFMSIAVPAVMHTRPMVMLISMLVKLIAMPLF